VLDEVFSRHTWSPPLTPSTAYDAQDSAVSNTAHETDPIEPIRSEDGPQAPLPIGLTDLENAILGKLDDDKAQDIVLIDLRGKSPMSDAMIIASGRSHRHVGALADHLQRLMKEQGLGKVKVSGLPHCDWVLLDAGDVIVHLFRPEVRAFYNIEKIWSVDSAHRVDARA
jgi:ribosome-associated protein